MLIYLISWKYQRHLDFRCPKCMLLMLRLGIFPEFLLRLMPPIHPVLQDGTFGIILCTTQLSRPLPSYANSSLQYLLIFSVLSHWIILGCPITSTCTIVISRWLALLWLLNDEPPFSTLQLKIINILIILHLKMLHSKHSKVIEEHTSKY